MRAVVMHRFGDESALRLETVKDPDPGAGEAVVRVKAVEVSSTRDVATRTGRHPFSLQVTLPHVLGGDFAGVVEAVGVGVEDRLVGERVAVSNSVGCGSCPPCRAGNEAQCPQLSMLGIHRWGSYAELVSVRASNLEPLPPTLPFPEAAALAATGPIAWTQLRTGKVGLASWLMVTGVTGALGTTLASLGVAFGAQVVGISRRPAAIPEGIELAGRLDCTDPDLAAQLLALTGSEGVAITIDNVAAGDVFERYFPALAVGSKVVISGAIGDARLSVNAGAFYLRSLSLLGVRTTATQDIKDFWSFVRDGFRLPDGLVREFPLEEVARAHAEIADGTCIGHTVLTV